ncbi:hypothetical protein P9139_01190 [Curtobacterium flaccumfaciens]|nr:hypothetical protein P9139_01190 [Curtobacterium flaccumfaciens]
MASSPLSGDSSFAFPEFADPPATPFEVARAWIDGARERDVSEPRP